MTLRAHPKPPKTVKKPRKPIPKRSKKYRRATNAERAYLLLIKSLPCIACGNPPISEAHHITSGGRRLGHYHTLPLCFQCHEGTTLSIGNTKKQFIAKHGTEQELLEKIQEIILGFNINNKEGK